MERVRFLEHKRRRIILLDASGCSAQETIPVLAAGRALIQSQALASVLTLTDFSGARFDDAASQEAETAARTDAPYVKAAAVVGVNGLKRIVFTAITRVTGRNLQLFDTREAALEWLATQ